MALTPEDAKMIQELMTDVLKQREDQFEAKIDAKVAAVVQRELGKLTAALQQNGGHAAEPQAAGGNGQGQSLGQVAMMLTPLIELFKPKAAATGLGDLTPVLALFKTLNDNVIRPETDRRMDDFRSGMSFGAQQIGLAGRFNATPDVDAYRKALDHTGPAPVVVPPVDLGAEVQRLAKE
jgi:hypothetical protein